MGKSSARLLFVFSSIIAGCFFLVADAEAQWGFGEDKREEVTYRYENGRKKVVRIYEGSGSSEELVSRKGYSSWGMLVEDTEKLNFWDTNPEYQEGDDLLIMLSRPYGFYSESKVTHNGELVAIERDFIGFTNKDIVNRRAEVEFCNPKMKDIQVSVFSKIERDSRPSYDINPVQEEVYRHETNISYNQWIEYINEIPYVDPGDFKASLYLAYTGMKSPESVNSINPRFRFKGDDLPEYFQSSGGFSLLIMNIESIDTGLDREWDHDWYVSDKSFSKSICK